MLHGSQNSMDCILITSGSLWEVKIYSAAHLTIYIYMCVCVCVRVIKFVVKCGILKNTKTEPERPDPQESIKIEIFKCVI
jgi:hypothetical protein